MSIPVNRAESSPRIDGILEPLWATADSIQNFIQTVPNEGMVVSEPTVAYLLQDDWAIYVAFRCRTPGRQPDCRQGKRESRDGDFVMAYFDTFHDRHSAYYVSVNAAGVQGDGVLSSDGLEENMSWDGVFYALTDVDSDGYTVEIAIPWTTLQTAANADTWGFNLMRGIPRNSEEAYCCPVSQNEGLSISRFGDLTGVSPARTTHGVELYPSGFFRSEKSYGEQSDDIQVAADVNYKPTSWVSLQSTFNPDFSQIEADPFALNLSKYNLYFEEKRPFFVEGAEFFQPSGGAMADLLSVFYSRQIGRKLPDGSEAPLNAGVRLTAKRKRFEVGSLVAFSGKEQFEGYFEAETEKRAVFAVDRVNALIGNTGSLGLMYAGRFDSEISNQVVSVDATVKTAELQLSSQVAGSFYESTSDVAFKMFLNYASRTMLVRAGATVIGDEFNVSEIGYVPWAGLRSYSFSAGPVVFPQSGPMTYGSIRGGGAISREFGEESYSQQYSISLESALRNGWGLGTSYTIGKVFELDEEYSPKALSLSVHTDVTRRLWLSLSYSTSYGYNYLRGHFGRSDFVSYYSSWRSSSRFSLYVNGYSWLEHGENGGVEEATHRLRPGIRVAIIKGMNLSLYEEVPVSDNDGVLSIRTGVAFSYNFLPKSWLYLAFNDWQERVDNDFEPLQRAFALKFRHLIAW